MKSLSAFILFLSVRFLSVILVQTSYVPDEYWQSLEVAHKIAFGYGYLTWEWIMGIRCYVHPLILASIYKLLEIIHLDYAVALIYIPRLVQAVLSAYSDLCFYQWAGEKKWAMFSISSAWFWFYVGSRTIVNTLETSLTTIALSQFPWVGKVKESNNKFLWIVGALVFIRPTAAIHWLPLCIYHLLISEERILSLLLKGYLPIGTACLIIFTLIDSVAHGSFVITTYEFLKANFVNNVGEWYGSLPWYWYLSSGLPAILGIQIVPFILGTICIIQTRRAYQNELAMLGCVVFTIGVYSFLSHKEFRFILPLLPIILYISSGFLSRWSHKANILSIWLVGGILLLGNLIPAFYLAITHQRGTLDVMQPLRDFSYNNPTNTSLLFLMPCHSTPLYSHLHVNVTTRFLTCEPNLWRINSYVSEADQFYTNPSVWLRTHYPPNGSLPSHIIAFDSLLPVISDILSRYKLTHSFFHTHVPSERVGRYVVIYEKIF